jgi:hypothetical protein
MITVYADNREIQVHVPTLGMSPQDMMSFLKWLEMDASARHSELVDGVVAELSDHVKSVWWSENSAYLIAAHGRPVKPI